jgi:hypothetical protein
LPVLHNKKIISIDVADARLLNTFQSFVVLIWISASFTSAGLDQIPERGVIRVDRTKRQEIRLYLFFYELTGIIE